MFATLLLFVPALTSAITISPLKQTVVVDPGMDQIIRLEVKNDGAKDVAVFPEVEAFSIDQSTGRPMFGGLDEATGWVRTSPSSMSLRAGEKKSFIFTILAPKGARAGGHYLGLFASLRPGDGQIGIGSRIGSLLFLLVSGEAREKLSVNYFSPSHTVFWRLPATLFLQLHNDGTVHAAPAGSLRVVPMIGDTDMATSQKIGSTSRLVLPGEREEIEMTIPTLSWKFIGRNRAVAYLTYGETLQRLRAETVFWYVPWQIVVGLGVVSVIVALALLWRRKAKLFL